MIIETRVIHYIEFGGEEYVRFAHDHWMVRMGESLEFVYFERPELEAEFQKRQKHLPTVDQAKKEDDPMNWM